MPQKVVIDTDFGTDAEDAIAVALAIALHEIEVQAFTVLGRRSVYRKQMLENSLSRLGSNCAIPPPPRLSHCPTKRQALRGLESQFSYGRMSEKVF